MLEKHIQKKILEYLKTVPNSHWNKITLGPYGCRGIADIVGCLNGRYVAFEVKNEKGRLTALQKKYLDGVKQSGGIAAVVRSVDDVKQVLENL